MAHYRLGTDTTDVDGQTFERSFDFSKLPNLQEVDFGVNWMSGSLLWIPTALSTLKPATSPSLFAIRFNLTCWPITAQSVQDAIGSMGNDLLWVTDEVARIEREFDGAVNLTLLGAVFDALNVMFHFCGADDTPRPC